MKHVIKLRPTIDELLPRVNSRKYPERWAEIYDEAMDDFERNGLNALDPAYYDRVSRDYDALTPHLDDYKQAAAEIAKDETLSRVLALVCYAMRDRDRIYGELPQFELPHNSDKSYDIKYEMFTAVALASMLDYTYNMLKERGFPQDQISYTMRLFSSTVSNYKARNGGRAGAFAFGYYNRAVDGRFLNMGRLQIELYVKASDRAVVFENVSGNIIHLATNARFHRDGYALGSKNYEDEEGAFDTAVEETDDAYIGHPYDEYGRAQSDKITLKKSEWKKTIAPGDYMVGLHIPGGGKMSSELIDKAFADSKEFLAAHFPEFDYRGFKCRSWLIDRQLVDLLGEETNISKFCNRFKRISLKSQGKDVFSFVYHIPETQEPCLEELPENTSLERALKAHFLRGGVIYEVDGFIPKDREDL